SAALPHPCRRFARGSLEPTPRPARRADGKQTPPLPRWPSATLRSSCSPRDFPPAPTRRSRGPTSRPPPPPVRGAYRPPLPCPNARGQTGFTGSRSITLKAGIITYWIDCGLRACHASSMTPSPLQDQQQVLGVDRAAGLDEYFLHCAVAGGVEGGLHLH